METRPEILKRVAADEMAKIIADFLQVFLECEYSEMELERLISMIRSPGVNLEKKLAEMLFAFSKAAASHY